jgi:uncharacterized membrane-anchored protein
VSRIALAALLSGMVGIAALAAAPCHAASTDPFETSEQVLAAVLRQSVGGPAKADLGDQATERLDDRSMMVPKEPAAKLLATMDQAVPPDFIGLLLGSEGIQAPGLIRFVPAGFIDANVALAWTPDDILASLNDTTQRGNAARVAAGQQEREVRGWVQAPNYNPETHQIAWAALILPKSAPRGSDGEITFQAIGFGREGYIHLSVVTSQEKAAEIGRMTTSFLSGLNFRPGKAYSDALPSDPRAPAGLPGAMGLDSLHKAESNSGLFSADTIVPVTGSIVAAIGALSLFVYIQRHMRRESRRG